MVVQIKTVLHQINQEISECETALETRTADSATLNYYHGMMNGLGKAQELISQITDVRVESGGEINEQSKV